MSRPLLLFVWSLPWLVAAAGGVALAVRRRRSPRAAGFALPAVVLLLAVHAFAPGELVAVWVGLPPPSGTVIEVWNWAHPPAEDIAVLLLAVAAVLDRGGRRA